MKVITIKKLIGTGSAVLERESIRYLGRSGSVIKVYTRAQTTDGTFAYTEVPGFALTDKKLLEHFDCVEQRVKVPVAQLPSDFFRTSVSLGDIPDEGTPGNDKKVVRLPV